jgi:hypothetical protein
MRTLILTPLLLTACFGTGDAPTAPAEATILLALDPPGPTDVVCNPSPYLGDVVIGDGVGFAVNYAFIPVCMNNSPGDSTAELPATLYEFPLAGGAATQLGTAGTVTQNGFNKPRLVADGDDVIYTFQLQLGQEGMVGSKSGTTSGTLTTTQGATTAASLVADASDVYIAGWNPPIGNPFSNDPRFPCCGSGTGSGPRNSELLEMTRAAPGVSSSISTQVQLYCEQTSRCMVKNSQALFYFEHGAIDQQTLISSRPIAGGPAQTIASFGRAPTSLAVNENLIVWSTSIDYSQLGDDIFGDVPESCVIAMAPLRAPFPVFTLIDTDHFSCMDITLDGDDLYFTITQLDRTTGSGGVVGVGLGRISTTTRAFATLATGNTAIETGIRRLFVSGDQIVGIGPLVVASFPKHAIDGRLEFPF